jgi:hypothetical protein
MPESDPAIEGTRFPGKLNEPQQRRLIITCKYIDSLLCDIENALHSTASHSAFPRYVVDITPAQAQEIEDHILLLRSQLLRTLEWQRMKPEPPEIEVTRLITTDLAFVDIALEELKPKHLRGCGAVPEDAVDELNRMILKLSSMVKSMDRYIRQEIGADPEAKARS